LPPLAACRQESGAYKARAKLGQFRSLGRRNFNRSLELLVGLSFSVITGRQQQQLTALPVKLGITPALIVLFRNGYGFIDEPKSVQSSSGVAMEHGPQSKMVRNPKGGVGPPELLKRRLVGGKTFIELPGFGDRPRPNDATPGAMILEAVLIADVARFRRRSERGIGLSSEPMQHRQIVEREGDAEPMRIFTSGCEPFLRDFQAANGIP
jgi:hypothetical protein